METASSSGCPVCNEGCILCCHNQTLWFPKKSFQPKQNAEQGKSLSVCTTVYLDHVKQFYNTTALLFQCSVYLKLNIYWKVLLNWVQVTVNATANYVALEVAIREREKGQGDVNCSPLLEHRILHRVMSDATLAINMKHNRPIIMTSLNNLSPYITVFSPLKS